MQAVSFAGPRWSQVSVACKAMLLRCLALRPSERPAPMTLLQDEWLWVAEELMQRCHSPDSWHCMSLRGKGPRGLKDYTAGYLENKMSPADSEASTSASEGSPVRSKVKPETRPRTRSRERKPARLHVVQQLDHTCVGLPADLEPSHLLLGGLEHCKGTDASVSEKLEPIQENETSVPRATESTDLSAQMGQQPDPSAPSPRLAMARKALLEPSTAVSIMRPCSGTPQFLEQAAILTVNHQEASYKVRIAHSGKIMNVKDDEVKPLLEPGKVSFRDGAPMRSARRDRRNRPDRSKFVSW